MFFRTEDLGLVAALQLSGVIPKQTRFDRRRLVCSYEQTADLTRVRDEYYSGRLHGPLNLFNSIVRGLGIQIKEGREVSHGSR